MFLIIVYMRFIVEGGCMDVGVSRDLFLSNSYSGVVVVVVDVVWYVECVDLYILGKGRMWVVVDVVDIVCELVLMSIELCVGVNSSEDVFIVVVFSSNKVWCEDEV